MDSLRRQNKPDTTTTLERAEAFLARLETLFTQGLILTLANTYTGVTLEFPEGNALLPRGQV